MHLTTRAFVKYLLTRVKRVFSRLEYEDTKAQMDDLDVVYHEYHTTVKRRTRKKV